MTTPENDINKKKFIILIFTLNFLNWNIEINNKTRKLTIF